MEKTFTTETEAAAWLRAEGWVQTWPQSAPWAWRRGDETGSLHFWPTGKWLFFAD
jgi:hypothetical protein